MLNITQAKHNTPNSLLL